MNRAAWLAGLWASWMLCTLPGCGSEETGFGGPGPGAASPTGGGGSGASALGGGGSTSSGGGSAASGGSAGSGGEGASGGNVTSSGGSAGAGADGGGGASSGGGGAGTGGNGGHAGAGGSGGDGGTGGAACVPPAAPSAPSPAHQAADVDFASVTAVDWADANGAASYDVYVGESCPPPAYPDGAYESVAASTLTGLTLEPSASYCWKVVALGAGASCYTEGPSWTFETACDDPWPGAPDVTSSHASYPAGTTASSYTLRFDEDVTGVAPSLTWTPISGTGVIGPVTPIDGHTYSIDFTGTANGDAYTLTVGTGVADGCDHHLAAPVDITIAIQESGQSCDEAIDLSSASLPIELTGAFDVDPVVGGSCDTTPTNAVWFEYTAPSTGYFELAATNQTTTVAWSVLVVFDGTDCSPLSPELSCAEAYDSYIEDTVYLTAGQRYLILFHTDDEPYTMVDPALDIRLVEGEGQSCPEPIDISAATFPFRVTGQFDFAAGPDFGCDASVYNVVWLEYRPATTGWFDVAAFNAAPSAQTARLAVFDGLGCAPPGPEVGCESTYSANAQVTVLLTENQPYLIAFGTNDPSELMRDPIIDITPGTAPPEGSSCSYPASTASSNYFVGGGGEDCWSWTADLGDTVSDNSFAPCDTAVGGDVVVAVRTGPGQTTLTYDATISNTQAGQGYVAVEILEASCTAGTSLECYSPGYGGPTSYTNTITVSPSTMYYVWVADGFADDHLPDVDLCLW